MAFNNVPKGRVVPFYLTDEGDVYPITFNNKEEFEFFGAFIAHSLGTVLVDLKTQVNDPKYKFTAYNVATKKPIEKS